MPQTKDRTDQVAGLIYIDGGQGSAEVIEAAAGDDGQLPRFRMMAYDGGLLQGLRGYSYPTVVDLDTLAIGKQQKPSYREHIREWIVGHTTSIAVVKPAYKIEAEGVFSGVGEHAREVQATAANKFPWQSSIGVRPGRVGFIGQRESVMVNGRKFTGPVYVARNGQLIEISWVSFGANAAARARLLANAIDSFEPLRVHVMDDAQLQAMGLDPATLSPEVRAAFDQLAAGQTGTPQPVTTNQTIAPPKHGVVQIPAGYVLMAAGAATSPPTVVSHGAQPAGQAPPVEAAGGDDDDPVKRAAATRKRIAAVERICARYHNPTISVGEGDAAQEVDLLAHALENDWSEREVELEARLASRPKAPAGHVKGSLQEAGHQVIEAAVCLGNGIQADSIVADYGEQVVNQAMEARFRGLSLHGLMHMTITAAGKYWQAGVVNDEFLRTAMEADRDLRAAGAAFSTIGVSNVLSNVANKALLESYNAVPVVWPKCCRVSSFKDFKTHTRVRLNMEGKYEEVGKGGTLEHLSLSDESYTNRLKTYGGILVLTREDKYNDDLQAFLDIFRALGRKGRQLPERLFHIALLDNSDSFFSSANANIHEGTDGALGLSALTIAEKLFLDAVDTDGDPIQMMGGRLLHPTALKTLADDLYTESSIDVRYNSGSSKVQVMRNTHAGKFEPVCSPWLANANMTNASSTGWYLIGNPMDVAAFEAGFLNGRQEPLIEYSNADFTTLGDMYRGIHDVGMGKQTPKAAIWMTGVAAG